MYTFDRLAEEVNSLNARVSTLEGRTDVLVALSIANFASVWILFLTVALHLGGI